MFLKFPFTHLITSFIHSNRFKKDLYFRNIDDVWRAYNVWWIVPVSVRWMIFITLQMRTLTSMFYGYWKRAIIRENEKYSCNVIHRCWKFAKASVFISFELKKMDNIVLIFKHPHASFVNQNYTLCVFSNIIESFMMVNVFFHFQY